MRMTALVLSAAFGVAASALSAGAAPVGIVSPAPQASNVVQVAGGCGWGFHRTYRGYCVRNWRRHYSHRHHRYYRPYAYRGYGYPPYPGYYRGGYEPWNRPSPSDHVANWLNAQELRQGYGGY